MVNFDEMKHNDKHTSFKDPRLFWKSHFLTIIIVNVNNEHVRTYERCFTQV